jgi:outer membrane lipoprotein SlyB
MNTNTIRISACGILAIAGLLAFNGCSQKPSSEEIAAQVRAAMAEEKAKEQAAAPAHTKAPAKSASTAHMSLAAREQPARAEAPAPVQKAVCTYCGVVVSVKEVEEAGKGSGLGVIAGGVTGGIVGNQVGNGTGRDLATIAGVIGGAIAGNKIEEKVKKTTVYDVTVRMDNGEEHLLRYKTAPGVMAGDKVKVENGHLARL